MNLTQEIPHGTLKLINATFCNIQIRCDHLESRSFRINVKQHDYQKTSKRYRWLPSFAKLRVRDPHPSYDCPLTETEGAQNVPEGNTDFTQSIILIFMLSQFSSKLGIRGSTKKCQMVHYEIHQLSFFLQCLILNWWKMKLLSSTLYSSVIKTDTKIKVEISSYSLDSPSLPSWRHVV